ncbi:hypothetical protein ABW19_dt0205189 [Dactylella cylindrospora]|nr:hypothetical protein ABW19_dt0205189 [Dactylella cylindrospora]
MALKEYFLSAVFTGLVTVGYKGYMLYKPEIAPSITYCTQPDRVYTFTEDEFVTIPDTATCFQVTGEGLFGEIWKSRDDVPQTLRTDVKELDGWVLPGFWDGHGHVVQYGMMESGVKVYNQDIPEIISSILAYLDKNPTYGTRNKWLQGNGWDQARFGGEMPTSEDLVHPLLADLYIVLIRVDVHCIWVSNAILSLLPSPLPTPPGGSIPSHGVFCDNAMDLVLQFMPPVTEGDIEGYITTAVRELNKVGLVGVMDAATSVKEIPVYKRLAEKGDLGMRIYGMAECGVRNRFCEVEKVKVINRAGAFILRAVKLFADGALGSWGAALIDPYDDKPTRGTMLINETELIKVTSQWYADSWQVNIHAIGDRANHAALNAFETAMNLYPTISADRRLRIEHAQIIHPEDQPRLLSLSIYPSIQPTHATSDMAYALSRLGSSRLKHSAYRMSSLFPTSSSLSNSSELNRPRPIFGSDFPVEPPAPLHGIYSATTRCNPNLDSCERDVLWEEEKVTRLQAFRGFGRNVGYGGWLEGYGVGKIVKGGWADWVLLGVGDVFDEEVDLRRVAVKGTWVGGKKVWGLEEQVVEA